MRIFVFFVLLLPSFCFSQEVSDDDKGYWDGDRVVRSSSARDYIAAMHNRFPSLKGNYEENGDFYYSNTVNSFGFQEILNPRQEVIFCGANDKTFSESFLDAARSASDSRYVTSDGKGVQHDATTVGPAPSAIQEAIRSALINNSNDTAKGRFCYDPGAGPVNYRQPGAENEVYCEPGEELLFSDSVSGFSCGLELDIPLKVGETRFVRQLQNGAGTIAQGFLGCYANPTSGIAEVSLVENPSSCSPSNRDDCIRTCDWADEVVCDPRDMPRWGGGKCGAYGTVMFKGDVLNVDSSEQLSFDSSSGTLYEGSARMACQMVTGRAEWIVTTSSCNPMNEQ